MYDGAAGDDASAGTHRDERLAAATAAAIAPYPWRGFTPDLFARLVLAASDRQCLLEALAIVPGAAVGPWEPLEPTDPDDARTPPLVEFLTAHRWTQLRLTTLCGTLLATLRP